MKKFTLLLILVVSWFSVTRSVAGNAPLSNWLRDMPDDMRISQMSIPRAHDAATWNTILRAANDQMFSETVLFDKGVRFFDMRLGGKWKLQSNGTYDTYLYFCHAWKKVSEFEEGIESLPTREQLDGPKVDGKHSIERSEFLMFDFGYDDDDDIDWTGYDKNNGYDKFYAPSHQKRLGLKRVLEALVKRYGTEDVEGNPRFIHFREDLTVKDIRGKILLFVGSQALAPRKYLDVEYNPWVTINCADNGKDYVQTVAQSPDISTGCMKKTVIRTFTENSDSERDAVNCAITAKCYLSQDYSETNRLGSTMAQYFQWAEEEFHSRIDLLNTQNVLFQGHLNGWQFPLGGSGTAADWGFLVATRKGANHLAYDYIKTVKKPLGVVGFDFCGYDSHAYYGETLLNEIIRHNYIQKELMNQQSKGYIADVALVHVTKTGNEKTDGLNAQQYLKDHGYEMVGNPSDADIIRNNDYNPSKTYVDGPPSRIYMGVKYTLDPDSALTNVLFVSHARGSEHSYYMDVHERRSNNNFSPAEDDNVLFWGSPYYQPVKTFDYTGQKLWNGDLNIHKNDYPYVYLWQERHPRHSKDDDCGALTALNILRGKDNDRTESLLHYMSVDSEGKWSHGSTVAGDANNTVVLPGYTYLQSQKHMHNKNGDSYDATGHFKYCTYCCYKFKAVDHIFDSDNAYVPEINGISHVAKCDDADCGFTTSEDCKADSYDEKGMGTCSKCKTTVYQPATLNSNSVYEIANAGQLNWFSRFVSYYEPGASAILTADIEVADGFLPIGLIDEDTYKAIKNQSSETHLGDDEETRLLGGGYQGCFDGQGHVIRNLHIDTNLDEYKKSTHSADGLFCYVRCGTVKNLGIVGSTFTSDKAVCASIAGIAGNALLENVYSQATVESKPNENGSITAGIVGIMYSSVLKNGYFAGKLQAKDSNKATDYRFASCFWTPQDYEDENLGIIKASTVSNFYCLDKEGTNGVIWHDRDADDLAGITAASVKDFQEAKVTFMLNNGDSNKDNTSGPWYQMLQSESYPTLMSVGEGTNTLYGGYQHRGTELKLSNDKNDPTIEGYVHTQPYDQMKTNTDENHDKCYEVMEGYPIWDTENSTYNTYWKFKCTVCQKELEYGPWGSKVTADSKRATCTEDGHLYHHTAFYLNLNACFEADYDQLLPALGHDFSQHNIAKHPDGWVEGHPADRVYSGGDGLYSYICANDASHHSEDVKLLMDFDSNGSSLVLDVFLNENGQACYKTNETIALTDKNQFKNIEGVSIYTPEEGEFPTYTRKMHSQWGTIVFPFAIDISEDDPYEVYSIRSIDNNALTLGSVSGSTTGGPYFIHIKDENYVKGFAYTLTVTARDNCVFPARPTTKTFRGIISFIGTYTKKDVTNEDGFIISGDKFWNIADIKGDNAVTCLPFHAYLKGSLPNHVKSLGITTEDDTTTAIDALNAITSGEAQYYDASGRRLTDLQHGVNIVKYGNGKTRKVIIK